MMADLRIATRASRLALAQAGLVADAVAALHPDIEVELVEITTSGDRDRATPVAALTETGAFVRSVQYAVLDGRADVAVHSGKDLPVDGPEGLTAVYPIRANPSDVLCGATLDGLAPGAVVGTGSPRRSAQLRQLRPDLHIAEIRGNVDTRLRQVDAGSFDAIVLAAAGLERIGLSGRIDQILSDNEMVPAPAQGALTLESAERTSAADLMSGLDDADTRVVVTAEREVLRLSGAGCRSALGAIARIDGGSVVLKGFVDDGGHPRTAETGGENATLAAIALCEALGIMQ